MSSNEGYLLPAMQGAGFWNRRVCMPDAPESRLPLPGEIQGLQNIPSEPERVDVAIFTP
ncbi:MAG: hypothetical protein OXC65_10110 [Thiotrichales bacterium]|nr:hypothetical protein [Thiotrichales bacterium]